MSQRPDDNKNLLIAVALSMAVMLGWQVFYAGPQIKEQQEHAKREAAAKQEAARQAEAPAATPALPGATTPGAAVPSTTSPAQSMTALPTATRDEALSKSARVPVETPSLSGSISLKGGLIDDLKLVNYTETVDPKSPKVVLFSPLGAAHAYFAEYGWQGAARSQV
ncbi:membrane protein insertase YidC, partial [uncultured Hyphomicrobium sp.]